MYKYVPKQGAPGRGRLVPNSGLTTADVARTVQSQIDDEMCGYYNKRNFFCTYTLQDYPDPCASPSTPRSPRSPTKWATHRAWHLVDPIGGGGRMSRLH